MLSTMRSSEEGSHGQGLFVCRLAMVIAGDDFLKLGLPDF